MTYPVWPAELPRPERNTWSRTWADPRLKRRGETGPPRWRRRFSAVPQTVSLSILLSRWQVAVFEQFWENQTRFGSTLFRMPDPTTDGWALLTPTGGPLLTPEGQPLLLSKLWTVSFGDEAPVQSVVGIEFRFSFSIVVMPS
ncbi:hypothetical protein ACFSDD_21035 [Salipiger marinus]|uniref:hypothetical protein n=1 Tax=Salipiger marinus TaxID=555512 RepID=UPI002BC4E857|nr:hypothetical protein [Salipiger manganoxidans]MEB3417548.1 hypothetical protein [Salipiger manganoxidans]